MFPPGVFLRQVVLKLLITTNWDEIDGNQILLAMEKGNSLEKELLTEVKEHNEHHHADDVFTSWGSETPKKYSKAEIDKILKTLSES